MPTKNNFICKKDINVINNLGMAYMEAGETGPAGEQFHEVLRIAPGNALALKKLMELKER